MSSRSIEEAISLETLVARLENVDTFYLLFAVGTSSARLVVDDYIHVDDTIRKG